MLFRQLMSKPGGIARTLRMMHQTHILWRILPEFATIDRLLQESRSHFFTVDEHSFRVIEEAEGLRLAPGRFGEVYAGLQSKELLHLALLLHDIGKGQEGDHSQIGADVAVAVAERLGLSVEERALLIFLVRRHLVFSEVAFYRDFSNEPVLLQFAREVARPEVLKALLVLTVADIRAVGPGTWTNWKGELLLKLYEETLAILTGEEAPKERKIEAMLAEIHQAARGKYPEIWLNEALPALTPRYLLATSSEKVLVDLAALFHLLIDPIGLASRYSKELGLTEYTLYTHDQEGLFSKMTGVLAAKGLQVVSAQIFTQGNGTVVDTFYVIDPDYPGEVSPSRRTDIEKAVRLVLTGRETVETLLSRGRRFQPQKGIQSLPVKVALDNESSRSYTVIDIFASDRSGLLYVIAKTLFDLKLSVYSARIATKLDQIVDVFYVLGPDHQKVTDAEKMEWVRTRLTDAIEAVFTPPSPL